MRFYWTMNIKKYGCKNNPTIAIKATETRQRAWLMQVQLLQLFVHHVLCPFIMLTSLGNILSSVWNIISFEWNILYSALNARNSSRNILLVWLRKFSWFQSAVRIKQNSGVGSFKFSTDQNYIRKMRKKIKTETFNFNSKKIN